MHIQNVKPFKTVRQPQSGGCSNTAIERCSGSEHQRQPIAADTGVRDELAQRRTMLANERTLLAYERTAIMLAVSAFTLLKLLSQETHIVALGVALVFVAFAVAVIGLVRFGTVKRQIAECAGLLTQGVESDQARTISSATRQDEAGVSLQTLSKTRQTERFPETDGDWL
jgi:putative membrane protein